MKSGLLFAGILLQFAAVAQSGTTTLFSKIETGKKNISITYQAQKESANKDIVRKQTLFTNNGHSYFEQDGKRIYLDTVKYYGAGDAIHDSLVNFCRARYKLDSYSEGTYSHVLIGLLFDDNGDVIARGFQRGSANREFDKKLFDMLPGFKFSATPELRDGGPVHVLKFYRVGTQEIQ